MNRSVTAEEITSLIGRIRSKIPDVTLRTSIIVGFPGETDKEFGELMDFLSQTRFERLGAFIYSREEGIINGENMIDDEPLSECCGAEIIHTDICSECKEHV